MIIFTNKGFLTRSDMPNEDWTDEALYTIEDGSELANKIQQLYPYYDFVLDKSGKLIDVVSNGGGTPTLEQVIKLKQAEIISASTATIERGVDYTFNEVISHYSLSQTDETFIMSNASFALAGKTVSWHADGEKCRIYSVEEFSGLYVTVDLFVVHHQTYSNYLKHQVEEMTDINAVKAVTYGTTALNTANQAEYETILANEKIKLGITANETTT